MEVVRVLAFGDSLTAGYHRNGFAFRPYAEALAEEWNGAPEVSEGREPRIDVDACGLSGWTAAELLEAANAERCTDVCEQTGSGLAWLLRKAEDEGRPYGWVVLMAGTNDLAAPGCSPESIVAHISGLHELCSQLGTRSLAVSVPESQFSVAGAMLGAKRDAVNQLLRDYVASSQDSVAGYIDMASQVPFVPGGGNWEPDGLHMSATGYTAFGKAMAHQLRQHLLGG